MVIGGRVVVAAVVSPRLQPAVGGLTGESRAQVLISNLTRNVGEEHIKEIFGTFGAVKAHSLVLDERSKVSRGIANVEFETLEQAQDAVAGMDGAQVDGNEIAVSLAPTRVARRSPPRGGGGGYGYGHGRGRSPPRGYRGGSPPRGWRPSPLPPLQPGCASQRSQRLRSGAARRPRR
jgi:hypothetical protein